MYSGNLIESAFVKNDGKVNFLCCSVNGVKD